MTVEWLMEELKRHNYQSKVQKIRFDKNSNWFIRIVLRKGKKELILPEGLTSDASTEINPCRTTLHHLYNDGKFLITVIVVS